MWTWKPWTLVELSPNGQRIQLPCLRGAFRRRASEFLFRRTMVRTEFLSRSLFCACYTEMKITIKYRGTLARRDLIHSNRYSLSRFSNFSRRRTNTFLRSTYSISRDASIFMWFMLLLRVFFFGKNSLRKISKWDRKAVKVVLRRGL